MTQQPEKKSAPRGSGFILGLIIGFGAGIALNNYLIGIGMGIALGAAFESGLARRQAEPPEQEK